MNRNTIIGLIIAILLIVGVGYGIYATTKNNSTTASVQGVSEKKDQENKNNNNES